MKKLYMIFLSAVAVSGCIGIADLRKDPEVPEASRYEFSAHVASLADPYLWKEGSAMGVYGTEKGENAKYVPYNEFLGKTGSVKVYGTEVDGTVHAYFPYNAEGYAAVAEGRCPYSAIQQYRSSASGHYSANAVLVAAEKNGSLEFVHRAGLIHFTVNIEQSGKVKSVRLTSALNALCGGFALDEDAETPVTDAGSTVTVRGMGEPEGSFEVWVLLPAGEYETLQLTVITDQGELVKPVRGKVPVRAGEVTEMTVVNESFEYTGSDFEIIGGIFD